MATVLTDAAIRKFRPGPKRRIIRDAGGRSLYLVIAPDGAKSFMMRFRDIDGRPAKMWIGYYDLSNFAPDGEPQIGTPVTLAGARRLAAMIHHQRALGRDVVAEHKARKQRRLVDHKNTFAAAARAYAEEHLKPKVRDWNVVARRLGLTEDLKPIADSLVVRWQDKSIQDITTHDIWSVVDEARRTAIPGTRRRTKGNSEPRARHMHGALSGMFSWLHNNRRVERNPVAELQAPEKSGGRERVLTTDEVRLFWHACDKVGEPYSTILRLLLLTGQRRSEVAGMRRSELQGDQWHLPGSRTKNGRPHVVPLCPVVMKLINAAGDRDPVFSTSRGTPPDAFSRAKTRLDVVMAAANGGRSVASWVVHDLRRTMVTHMAELGIRVDVIELIVNHTSGTRGGIAGVYNRSELLEERRRALEQWAQRVERIVSRQTTSYSLSAPYSAGAASTTGKRT
jgi:integrase